MEQGKRMSTEVGSPQGATVSPLLANICLHYALDLWVQRNRSVRYRLSVVLMTCYKARGF
jgi:RNA-directed DNA polymerase